MPNHVHLSEAKLIVFPRGSEIEARMLSSVVLPRPSVTVMGLIIVIVGNGSTSPICESYLPKPAQAIKRECGRVSGRVRNRGRRAVIIIAESIHTALRIGDGQHLAEIIVGQNVGISSLLGCTGQGPIKICFLDTNSIFCFKW